MKSMIKLILGYVQKKEADKATKILSKVVSAIDTCAKKNIIHKNNAAHKKARIQKAMNSLKKGGAEKVEKPVPSKVEGKEVKPKAEKKEAKPKVEKKEAKPKTEEKEAKKK